MTAIRIVDTELYPMLSRLLATRTGTRALQHFIRAAVYARESTLDFQMERIIRETAQALVNLDFPRANDIARRNAPEILAEQARVKTQAALREGRSALRRLRGFANEDIEELPGVVLDELGELQKRDPALLSAFIDSLEVPIDDGKTLHILVPESLVAAE